VDMRLTTCHKGLGDIVDYSELKRTLRCFLSCTVHCHCKKEQQLNVDPC
jgi:hypothetical protein